MVTATRLFPSTNAWFCERLSQRAPFERGYQELKRSTDAFADVTNATVEAAVEVAPIAYQGVARSIDRKMRVEPFRQRHLGTTLTDQRIRAMIDAGVRTLLAGVNTEVPTVLHRLDKADTKEGLRSLQPVADLGVPYPVLLYERYLGRPFASHRDSVSELVGEVVEGAIKDVLTAAKVSFRESKRAERIAGFDQAPDFIVPDEFNPVALIEAKLTEDDGTARDKVSRVQRLQALRNESGQTYDVIACIAGRGFKVRREDMRRLLQATDGKVFTLSTMHLLIDQTRIREYRSRQLASRGCRTGEQETTTEFGIVLRNTPLAKEILRLYNALDVEVTQAQIVLQVRK